MAGACGYSCASALVVVPFGASDSSHPLQWNVFVSKMAKVLDIGLVTEDGIGNFMFSRLQGEKSDKNNHLVKMPIGVTLHKMIKAVENEATSAHIKSRPVRVRTIKLLW